MQLSLTLILCLATGVVSWQALSNSELFSKLSLSPYRVKHNKEIYRIWSHTLVHADMGHLFFNLFALFSFGRAVEHYMPPALFALLYMGAAAFATLPALKKHGDNIYYTSVGASGAVSAVMMLYMFMFPTSELLFFFILPLPGWAAIILFFGLEYYMNKKMNTAIAHDAHLAGAAFGIAFLLIWKPQEFLDFFVVVFHSIAGQCMIPGANFKMKSGISWWVFGPVLGLFMVSGFLTVQDSLVMLALYIPLTAFILAIIFNTHYTITSEGKLKVFCGIFPFPTIDISDITHYKYTNNPISSPAASLKRLALYHNGRILVIISPENRDLFVEVLKQHNTSLQQK